MPGIIHSQRIINLGMRSYSTSFAATENPISEGGNWINGGTVGLDWGDIRTTGGNAVGTLAASLHDNTAILTGTWAANQYVESTIYKGSPDGTYYPEVEHRLRTTLTAGVNSGYEVAWGLRGGIDSYLIIVRWNGPAESYDYLLNASGSQYAVATGDAMRSEINGNTITAYLNGVLKGTADITSIGGTVYNTGKPGMGTNADTGGDAFLDQYGFADFAAGDL